MKIKKIKSKKYSLLELTLKKFQLYKKNSIHNLELKFKQILYIISSYHLSGKKILFIGLPYSKSQSLLKYSKHTFIPTHSVTNYLNNPHKLKNINLIVFFNPQLKDTNILKEFQLIKKPFIAMGQYVFVKNKLTSDYAINFNMKFIHLKQFCAFIIYAIIKKV